MIGTDRASEPYAGQVHRALNVDLSPSLMCASHENAREYVIRTFDDGSVRVRGPLPPEARAQLELTHFDTGTVIGGWSVWMPKETGDDD